MHATEDAEFRRTFFQNVSDAALEPTDPRYEPLYGNQSLLAGESDPVELMAWSIESTPGQSVQLLSGFRGTGKTTELNRLRKRLEQNDYLVVYVDIDDYLGSGTSVDISDFLMVLAGAFGDRLASNEWLGQHPTYESYWTRVTHFLTHTQVQFDGLTGKVGIDGAAVDIKANLKNDPSFRRRLQEHMSGYLGAFVRDVHQYFEECVKKLHERLGQQEVVFIVDSIEHIRGTSITAAAVQISFESLFAGQADKLHLPDLHVIYTIHPYLKIRSASLGGLYAPGGIRVLPTVKVRTESDRRPFDPGVEALVRIVEKRGDWERLLGDVGVLRTLILHSGGHLRDLMRLIAEVLRRARTLPASQAVVDAAVSQIRSEFLPIADADALWLARIADTHSAALEDVTKLTDLARYLDTHLVLCYWNGHEWYDVHPLIYSEVRAQAASISARANTITDGKPTIVDAERKPPRSER